jgi:hypothetical protein
VAGVAIVAEHDGVLRTLTAERLIRVVVSLEASTGSTELTLASGAGYRTPPDFLPVFRPQVCGVR